MGADVIPRYTISGSSDQGLRCITVTLEAPSGGPERDHLLTQGVVDLVEQLVEATHDPATAAAIDLRIGDGDDGLPAIEAFVEASRGLVQSYVLEMRQGIGPVNVVVTNVRQEGDRQKTWQYLASPHGSFSRGATYDLRESRA